MKKPIILLVSESYIISNFGNVRNLYIKIGDYYYTKFEPEKVRLLKQLIHDIDAYIVVSSSWCEKDDLSRIKEVFKAYDLDDRVIDIVPFFPQNNGYRINKWIDNNKGKYDDKIDINNFAILDNDNISLFNDRHVKCNSKVGLTENDVVKTMKLLKK